VAVKLYWSPRSPFARKVMVCAHEVGLAARIECVPTAVAMERPNRALMRDNPLSRIPTLITGDGLALADSTLICEYLDRLHRGPRLFPPPPRRWPALRRHALADGLLDVLVLWRNERLRPAAQRSAPLLAAFATKTAAALDAFEREAAAFSRAPFDVGHAALGCALGYLDFRFGELDWRRRRRALAAWHEGFAARPAARATAPRETA
jgi:glutathione S-transferase